MKKAFSYAIMASLTVFFHATSITMAENTPAKSAFDQYARTVETLSKTAGPEYRAVIATQRIPAGATIDKKWLQLIPLIDYGKVKDGIPQPYLVRRAENEFGAIDEIAGKVALQDISEQAKVKRSQVGTSPANQFEIGPKTRVIVRYLFRRGAVLPGAPAEIHECTLDTSKMPPQDGSELKNRLERSRVLVDLSQKYQMSDGGYENYSLEITVGSTTKKVLWSGDHAPASIRTLVDYLERHSTKRTLPGKR